MHHSKLRNASKLAQFTTYNIYLLGMFFHRKLYGHGVYLYNVYMLNSSSFPLFSRLIVFFFILFIISIALHTLESVRNPFSMYVFISHAILDYLMAKNISF